MKKPAISRVEWTLSAPSMGWLLLLFCVPLALVAVVVFKPSDIYGNIGQGWTLSNLKSLANPLYPMLAWRTLWMSLGTALGCVVLALPCGYYVARLKPQLKQPLLLLIMLPFWTNFLIRVFAWKVLLHPEGALKGVLVVLGLAEQSAQLLYNPVAVLVVQIYSFLPFAILPLFAAADKFEFGLLDAARDLGAGKLEAFVRVFLPGISQGLLTALLLVFIPALGSYLVPDIVGGPAAELIGNKIAQRTFLDRNLPHAAALSLALVGAVLLPLLAVLLFQGRSGRKGGVA